MHLSVVGLNEPALVDDCMAHLAVYRWRLDKQGYVMRKAKGKRIYLHHVVLPGRRYPEFVRDHINRDKLDNRSANLRWLTLQQSAQNKGAYERKHKLGLRGVMPIGSGYRATATLDGRIHRLGTFRYAAEAALAASTWRKEHMPFSVE